MLRADGSSTQVPSNPGEPIIFQARVLLAADAPPTQAAHSGIAPAPPKKGQTAYTIHYTLPASAVQPSNIKDNLETDPSDRPSSPSITTEAPSRASLRPPPSTSTRTHSKASQTQF
jgi:hypothetical protein